MVYKLFYVLTEISGCQRVSYVDKLINFV